MEKKSFIIVFTIFSFLFFTISTATNDEITLSTQHEPKTTPTTETVPEESETTQVFDLKTMDPPRMIINRHFYENTRIPLRFYKRQHPCKNKFKKMFMIQHDDQNNYKNKKRVVSYGNDMILSDLTTRFDVERFPTKRFEFKRKYHHHHEKVGEFGESKYERKEMKKKERKGGFMRGFRKFLKHTFD